MEKAVRISTMEQQDEVRRQDMQKMTPAERLLAMFRFRDRLFPYEPLARIVTIRKID